MNDVRWIEPTGFSKPRAGFTYAVVDVTIENLGPGTLHYLGSSDFQVKDASGVLRDDDYISEISDCALESVDLIPGGRLSGCIAFEVPKLGQIELIYAPYQYGALEEGRYLSFVIRPSNSASELPAPLTPLPLPNSTLTEWPIPAPQTMGPIWDSTYDEEFSVLVEVDNIQWFGGDEWEKPKQGHIYSIVYLTVENLGPGTVHYLSRSDFQVKDANGVLRDADYIAIISDCALESVDLLANGETYGCIVFEVPDSGPLEMIYAPYQYDSMQEGRYLSFTLRP